MKKSTLLLQSTIRTFPLLEIANYKIIIGIFINMNVNSVMVYKRTFKIEQLQHNNYNASLGMWAYMHVQIWFYATTYHFCRLVIIFVKNQVHENCSHNK